MIEIKNVSKTYSGKVKAVDELNLSIEAGEIVGFIGPNGAGKTTTIKMMTGILNPDQGDVLLNGISIKENPLAAKQQFGYVADSPDLFLRLKGIEYINFIADIYGIDSQTRRERLDKYAKLFEMEKALNDKILSYSHGMRQKIILLGVLVHEPSIWILDEPLTGLDPQSAFSLKEVMREQVKKGNTVFFSTHVLEVAEKLCTRILLINHGQILFNGTLDALKQAHPDESLEAIFLKVIQHG